MSEKTPLYDCHIRAKGKMVPFAGFELPVEYPTGLIAEHTAVRTCCGMFDVSHMAELVFKGKGALSTLNRLLTNDFTDLDIGRCRYALMCNDAGGTIDDLIVYRLAEESFLAVVNAANHEKDAAWMQSRLLDDCDFVDLSSSVAQIALQGPLAEQILSRICDASSLPRKYYSFVENCRIADADALVSRTGYTGEDGFEIYCACTQAASLWETLFEAGRTDGLVPCGLGARDTLRLEAAMPLYGHELTEDITPIDAGLSFAVKLDTGDFIGREALCASKENPRLMRIGIEACGRGIVREGAQLYRNDTPIGQVTSGTYCPTLARACAMASVEAGCVRLGDEVYATVRKRRIPCKVCALPFYRRAK